MSLLSLFAFTIYAAEHIISPLPDSYVSTPVQPQVSNAVTFGQLNSRLPNTEAVLGIQTDTPSNPQPTTHNSPASPTGGQLRTNKHYTIALLGDSMIDTLGPDAPQVTDALKARYPNAQFTIRNYGVGATNIDYGIERITHDYTYLGKQVPSLASTQPDLIVVESFGYNPYSFTEGALEKHWMALATIVDLLKATLPRAKIVIAATIAPNPALFGDGAPGLAFSPSEKQEKVAVINRYLESTIAFAKGQGIPLADAYHPSLIRTGVGNERYINSGDHIHYSDKGRILFGETLAATIADHALLQ